MGPTADQVLRTLGERVGGRWAQPLSPTAQVPRVPGLGLYVDPFNVCWLGSQGTDMTGRSAWPCFDPLGSLLGSFLGVQRRSERKITLHYVVTLMFLLLFLALVACQHPTSTRQVPYKYPTSTLQVPTSTLQVPCKYPRSTLQVPTSTLQVPTST